MHKIFIQAGVFLSVFGFYPALAFAFDIPSCPSEIKVEQKAHNPTQEWSFFNSDSTHPFVNIRFSEGEPSQQIFLAPSKQEKRKGSLVDVWKFSGAASTNYWIACVYSETSVLATRKLPHGVKSCEVEYDKAFSTPVAKRFVCK